MTLRKILSSIVIILWVNEGPTSSESCQTTECMINLTINFPLGHHHPPPRQPPPPQSQQQSCYSDKCVRLNCTACNSPTRREIINYYTYKNICSPFHPPLNMEYCCHQDNAHMMALNKHIRCSPQGRYYDGKDDDNTKQEDDSSNEQSDIVPIVIGPLIVLALVAIFIILLIGVLRKVRQRNIPLEGRGCQNMICENTEFTHHKPIEEYVSRRLEPYIHMYAELDGQPNDTNNISQHLYEDADKYYRDENIPPKEINKHIPKFKCIITPPDEDQQVPDNDRGTTEMHTEIEDSSVVVENPVSTEHDYAVLEQEIIVISQV